MNLAQVLIAVFGLGASIATFCLMRLPDSFRQYGAFSVTVSLIRAAGILALCVLMVLTQGPLKSARSKPGQERYQAPCSSRTCGLERRFLKRFYLVLGVSGGEVSAQDPSQRLGCRSDLLIPVG